MTEDSLRTRCMRIIREKWRNLSESYVKRLPFIYIVVLLVLPLPFFLILYSLWMGIPIIALTLLVTIFHARSVANSARKVMYPERLIRLERWRLFCFALSIFSYIILIAMFLGLSFMGFIITDLPFPLGQTLAVIFVYLTFFIVISLMINARSFQTPYRMAKLCLRATIDTLEEFLKQKRKHCQSRSMDRDSIPPKEVHRYFKWLRLGFQNCNDFLLEKPYLVKVKDIDVYHQHIVSSALIGDRRILERFSKDLQNVFTSLGNTKSEFSLSRFLKTLQLVLQKSGRKRVSTRELSKMILIKASLWDRVKVVIRSPITVSLVGLVTLIVTVLAIVSQFLLE